MLLVRHMPGERDDRVQRELQRRGYATETVWVAEGQPLPEPDSRYAGAVVYGGSQMASESDEVDYLRAELAWIERWLKAERRYLGICLGAQTLAKALGGKVARHPEGLAEIGYVEVQPTEVGRDLIPGPLSVYHWHREGFDTPGGGELLATGPVFENQAFRYGPRVYGLQFHPEVTIEMMTSWMTEAAHLLEHKGAHPRERQLADAARHHEPLGEWLVGFLDRWLEEGG